MIRYHSQVVGDEALVKALKDIGKAAERKVMRSVASAGAVPLNKDLKRRSRSIKLTGLLSRSIGTVRRQYTRGKGRIYVAVTGVRGGFRTPRSVLKFKKKKYPKRGGKLGPRKKKKSTHVNPMKYFRFVERGTKVARANPIFKQAAMAQRKNMERAMQNRADERMRQEVKKVADEQLRRYKEELAQAQSRLKGSF